MVFRLLLLLFGLVAPFAGWAPAQTPDFTLAAYKAPTNPFDQAAPTWYECTRYAWGRAQEKTGVALQFSVTSGRNGGTWYGYISGLARGSEPRANAIADWSGPGGGIGHVAYVESVSGDNVTISEANWASPVDGLYKGTKVFTKQGMTNRSGYTLNGYIYLDAVAALLPPVLSGPGATSDTGALAGSLTPTFTWGAVMGASRYGLYISKEPYGAANVIYRPEDLTGTEHAVPFGTLQAGIKYKWNMSSINAAGVASTTYSTPLYFTAPSLVATLSISRTQTGGDAIGVYLLQRRTEGNNLVGTLHIENFSGTWIYIEVDPTSTCSLPQWVYLLGPGAIKQFPDFVFPRGAKLRLTTTTPVGLDYSTTFDPKQLALSNAFIIDLIARGLLTFSLPADFFDRGILGPLDELTQRLFEPIGGLESYRALGQAAKNRDIAATASALRAIVQPQKEVESTLVELLRNEISDRKLRSVVNGILDGIEGIADVPEKVRLLEELTVATHNAPPLSTVELQVVQQSSVPTITSVAPAKLSTKPLEQTQALTIRGSGFTATTTLVFTTGNATYASRSARLSYVDSGTLIYQIAVGSAEGVWSVRPADGIVSATFEVERDTATSFVITPVSGPNGTLAPASAFRRGQGESQTFVATPQNAGFVVDTWYVDDVAVSGGGDRFTLASVQRAHAVRVTFKAAEAFPGSGDGNDTQASASPLTFGATFEGLIASAVDVDWHLIQVPGPGTISLQLLVPTGKDYEMELHGGSPSGLLKGSYQAAGLAESITFSVVAGGSYYVLVYGHPLGNGASSATAKYALSASFTGGGRPAAPSAVSAVAVSSSQVNIAWRDVAQNETGFKIERAATAAGPWTSAGTTLVNTDVFSDQNRSPDTIYYYRVTTFNVAGDSEPSPVANAKTFSATGAARNLTIHSLNPDSGVSIQMAADKNGLGSGATPATRTYDANKIVAVVASATAGTNAFQKWQRDGVDFGTTATAYVTMDTDHTLTAIYGTAGSTRTLSELAINGSATVPESTSQNYTATAKFSDNSTLVVTPQAWTLTPVGAPATISATGVLDAGSVNADTAITVQASYTFNGVTKAGTKVVTIANTVSTQVYTLGLTVGAHGYVSRTPNQNQFEAGAQVTLRATSETNYRFTGWGGDAAGSGTTNPITVTMTGNKSITASFVYDATYFGSVHTVLSPSSVVPAGGRWRLDNAGPWKGSGDTVTPNSNGSHNVFFSEVSGYTPPPSQSIQVVSGQINEIAGTYVSLIGPGALQVSVLPQGALDAGAQWRVQGGSGVWQNSGATLANVTDGTYALEFKGVTGWALPAAQSVTVAGGGTAVASAIYSPPAGVPTIYSVGPKTGPIAGGTDVTIDGANFIAPVVITFGGVSAASVTIESPSRIIARTPVSVAYRTVSVSLTAAGGSASVSNGFTYIVPRGDHMDLVGQIGGWVQAVAVQGNYLYVGEGCGFVVYDVTSPVQPTPIGRLPLPDMIRDIAVSGKYAYVAAGTAGFFIVDISGPTTPVVRGFYDTPGVAEGVTFQGGFAYLADGGSGLHIFDCSDPSAPTVRSTLASGGHHSRVALMTQGSNVYACIAATGLGLHTIDVTNPASPAWKSTFDTAGDNYDVTVLGTKAYVANTAQQGLQIINLTNPQQPVLLGQAFGGDVKAVAVSGTTAFVAAISGFKAINVANASDPQTLSVNGTAANVASKIVLSGNYAYLAEADMGLRIVSIASPSSMTQVANVRSLVEVGDISVKGSTIFAAGGNTGFSVIDAANSASLRVTGRLEFAGLNTMSVASSDTTTVFVGTTEGIKVVRADSNGPQLLSTYTQSKPASLAYDGFLLATDYDQSVAPWKARFQVLENWSSPSALTVYTIGQYVATLTNTGAEGSALRAINWASRAYFSDAAGVHVVDFTRPTRMARMGDVVTPGLPSGLAVANNGTHLLVANRIVDSSMLGGVSVVDVQNGNAPAVVKTVLTGMEFLDARVEGSLAYVAGRGDGIYVLDVSDVLNPVVRARYNTAGSADAVRVANGLVYVADRRGGLLALRLRDFATPTITITTPSPTVPVTTTASTITVSGSAIDDTGVISVTWANTRGGGGAASGTTNWQVNNIQLQPGANILTFTATDAMGNAGLASFAVNYTPIDATAPVMRIIYPSSANSIVTASQSLEMRGTAADNQGVMEVSWTNSRGGTGSATGTTSWTAMGIPLLEGPNIVTVAVKDAAGNSATSVVTVTYISPDTELPAVTISFPTLNASVETRESSINISGIAADDRGVVKVTWTNTRGGSGTAVGTTIWSVNAITLQLGLNVLTLAAEDEAGNRTEDTLAVTFAPPAAPAVATPPANTTVTAGQLATFTVGGTGTPAPTYQWQRQPSGAVGFVSLFNGGAYSGVFSATLTVSGTVQGMTGDQFRCVISNGVVPDATSSAGALTVNAAPLITSASNVSFMIGVVRSFAMTTTGAPAPTFSVSAGSLPTWATLNPATGAISGTAPDVAGAPFTVSITATNGILPNATQSITLTVHTRHSADTTPDGSISLVELTRVLELYNVRNGTLRTGRYAPATATVDGFALEPTASGGAAVLTRYHSADTNRDGRLSLTELTRVIELFNTRVGTTRTGAYRVSAGSEDGFAPGP